MTQNNSTGRKTLEIKEMFLETSKRFADWTMLVAVDENGDEWILEGDYCGGIPVSSWHKVKDCKSVQAQEDVKTASDIHVTHKLPSEVEQRFDEQLMRYSVEDPYGKGSVETNPAAVKAHFATEQVATLKRVLGLIGEDEHVGLPTTAIQEERNNYKKERNKVRRELRSQVQAILKEYEV